MNSTNTLWIIIIMWWVCDAKEDYDSYIVLIYITISDNTLQCYYYYSFSNVCFQVFRFTNSNIEE